VTSSVSSWLAYPILCATFVVVLGRVVVLKSTRSTRRITAALGFVLASGLLRENVIQLWVQSTTGHIVDVQLVRQISTVLLMLAMVPLVVMGAGWVLGSRSESWASRIYLAAGLCSLFLVVVGTRAREGGVYIDITSGWETIAYFAVFSIWTAAMSTLYLAVSLRELRRGKLPRTNVTMFVLLAILSLWGLEESISILIAGVSSGVGAAGTFVQMRVAANENNLIYILLFSAAYAAVPLLYRCAEAMQVDRWSRAYRALTPMWADLVATCPEVVAPVMEVGTSARQRTHRMSIEIRDALSVLGRFHDSCADTDGSYPGIAAEIAEAAARRQSGAAPSHFRSFELPPAAYLSDEVQVLTSIAVHWPDLERGKVH
jgi:hypothetical protein